MTTYKRKCLQNYKIEDGNNEFILKKDKVYITSKVYNNKHITVFSEFWCHNIPIGIFSAGKKYT
jgi:hypothetical protein